MRSLILGISFVMASPPIALGTIQDCIDSTKRLQSKTVEAAKAEELLSNANEDFKTLIKKFEGAKREFESACGYDQNDSLTCGPYSYKRRGLEAILDKLKRAKDEVEAAELQLGSAIDEVRMSSRGVANRCDAASHENEKMYMSLIKELRTHVKLLDQELQECKGSKGITKD